MNKKKKEASLIYYILDTHTYLLKKVCVVKKKGKERISRKDV